MNRYDARRNRRERKEEKKAPSVVQWLAEKITLKWSDYIKILVVGRSRRSYDYYFDCFMGWGVTMVIASGVSLFVLSFLFCCVAPVYFVIMAKYREEMR